VVVIDRRRATIISADYRPRRCPRLFCQSIATGRRLQAVTDLEFQDEGVAIETEEMILSPNSQYLAVAHSVQDCSPSHSVTFYTAIWKLKDEIDFSGETRSLPWARKVMSFSTKKRSGFSAKPLISFDGNLFLCCPNGRIELSTGLEQQSLYSRYTYVDSAITTFSASGGVVVTHHYEAPNLEIARATGDVEDISFDCEIDNLKCISHTGRYIVYRIGCPARTEIYDQTLHEKFILDFKVDGFIPDDYIFSSDDRLLVVRSHCLNTGEDILGFGSLQSSTFNLLETKRMGLALLGWCLDNVDDVLYIVTQGRIWSRLQLTDGGLHPIDSSVPWQQYGRVEQCVSCDGARLALLHIKQQR
jgi:hypothetical protein